MTSPPGPSLPTRATSKPHQQFHKLSKSFKEALTIDGREMSDHASHDSQDYGLSDSAADVVALTNKGSAEFTAEEESPGPQTVHDLLPPYNEDEDEDYHDASSDDPSSLELPTSSERSTPLTSSERSTPLSSSERSTPPPSEGSADSRPAAAARAPAATAGHMPQTVTALRLQLAAAQSENAQLKTILGKRNRDKYSLPDKSPALAHPAVNPALARMLHKPPTFNGSPGSNLRLWLTQMSHFLEAQGLQQRDAVFTAASYLVDDAAAFWISESDRLTRKGTDPFHWRSFKTALFGRFGYKNAELTARDRLHNLRQNKMSFAHYVNAFDDCYAYIPKYEEGDKIHRFLNGLRPIIRSKLKINPSTGRLWTRYNAMVAYGHVLINESEYDSADVARDILAQQPSVTDTRPPKKPRTDPSSGNAGAGASNNNIRDDKVPAADVNGGLEKQFTVCRPNGNVTFTRDRKLARYCMARKVCAHCFRKGHSPNYCRSSKREGFPPGFDPNHKPKGKQQ